MSLKIIDCSHWNGTISWKKVADSGISSAIIKCSEGKTFVDPMFQQNKSGARRSGLLCGYYHFARGLGAKEEADFFVKSVGDILPGEFLALDWEINHPTPVSWCWNFLREVENLVGFKPLIYINSSTAKKYDWSPVVKNNSGLWIAAYGLNLPVVGLKPPAIGKWPFYAIWQYSSRGKVSGINGFVDLNYSKMDLKTLQKYGKPNK